MKVRELIEKLLDYDMDAMVVVDTTRYFTVVNDVRHYSEYSGKAACLDLRDAVSHESDTKEALAVLEAIIDSDMAQREEDEDNNSPILEAARSVIRRLTA